MTFNIKHHTNVNRDANLKLGFSPCPNDTFIFDAMVHHKIDTEELAFDVVMEDVEKLNRMAEHGIPDITKLSFAAFTQLTGEYQMLNAGGAMGKGLGPLLIFNGQQGSLPGVNSSVLAGKSLDEIFSNGLPPETWMQFANWLVAIPGKNTTADFLLRFFFPDITNKKEMVFSEIENAVLSGNVHAGVIIHENRFTYGQKGLKKICDLGTLWEMETGLPIPLGGIAVKRNLPGDVKQKIDRVVRRSVEYAIANPESCSTFVKEHAQEMDEEVRRKHIETYVNEFSVDFGEMGRNAIHVLFQKAKKMGMIQSVPSGIFVNQNSVNV